MMRYKWLPWKFIVRHVARTGGFIDPVALLAQFNKFSRPSEVAVPVELLRAGLVFHARGLINARTIQGNLDWVWPFWVRKQFDPQDKAFVPRSFALTHVNLTHRNWTAVGLPGDTDYPIVDPRGLVTPYFDGWSLDAWIITSEGKDLLPPNSWQCRQVQLNERDRLAVDTTVAEGKKTIRSMVYTEESSRGPVCRIRYVARSDQGGFFVVALRPFNPEGISFIYNVGLNSQRRQWTVNGDRCVVFDKPVGHHVASDYRKGDVYSGILERPDVLHKSCDIGLASAAAVYRIQPDDEFDVTLSVARDKITGAIEPSTETTPKSSWAAALPHAGRFDLPDEKMTFLYESALRTLILLSPLEVYPGPFYYKRFWFRDAVFILHALLGVGLHDRVERAIDHFIKRQDITGYFESQKGEWDSNGQVLWILQRFTELTGKPVRETWLKAAGKGARWILRKRLPADSDDLHAGLLPAGFSAEHLGNNDFYYWDDFWGIAGLRAAATLFRAAGFHHQARRFDKGAEHFELCVERSLLRSRKIRRRDAIPASPHRRMDAGAVGSIVAGYPLKLWHQNEPRLLNTLDFLMKNCVFDDAFFQDMIHSGFNVYLTLHCAQNLLRAGDSRFLDLVEKVAELASPTGHWPEAVHPQTLGGCMGDGQHAWAAAEWILMVHSMFVAEEGHALILLSGVPEKWLKAKEIMEIGPIHTRFGAIDISVETARDPIRVTWRAEWHEPPSDLFIRLPGTTAVHWDEPAMKKGCVDLSRD